ncbi:hypothetical protein Tco_0396196 [Tanacetum coccineum]
MDNCRDDWCNFGTFKTKGAISEQLQGRSMEVGTSSNLYAGSCTRAETGDVFWPQFKGGPADGSSIVVYAGKVRLIGGSADGSSTSGSAAGSLVGDASITWSVTVLSSSGLWQLFTSFHALFYRRLGKWHTRGVIQVSVLTRVLDLGPSVAVFRAFYTRMYSDGLFSFAKRSLSALLSSKPQDSIKTRADHFSGMTPELTSRRYPEMIFSSCGFKVTYYQFVKILIKLLSDTDGNGWVKILGPYMGLLEFSGLTMTREGASLLKFGTKGRESGSRHLVLVPGLDPSVEENVVLKKNVIRRVDSLNSNRPGLIGGKSLASLRQSLPEDSFTLGVSSPADIPTHVTVSRYIRACHFPLIVSVPPGQGACFTPSRAVGGVFPNGDRRRSRLGLVYETAVLNSKDAKRWYVPRWNITNDSLLDDGFSCRTLVDRVAPPGFFSTLRNMDYDQLFEEFNVGAAQQICLGLEVRSRAEHELEFKEKLRVKYDARGVLLREKDAEIAKLKSLLKEKETKSAEKDTDISLFDSRASYLKSALDDSQAACDEARSLISSLSSERDGIASEVSTLHSAFRDFKEKMEAQQEEQAQELYNRVSKN